MAQNCPQCGCINTEAATVCDCGYEFKSRTYKFCTECGTELSGAERCPMCGAACDRAVGPALPPTSPSRPGFSLSASADVQVERKPASEGSGLSVGGRISFQGARNNPTGPFCEKCKEPITDLSKAWAFQSQGRPIIICDPCYLLFREQQAVSNLVQIDAKPDHCHRCGTTARLLRHEFGIAKQLSTKRDWSRPLKTAAIVTAANLITIPFGRGVFAYGGWTPGKIASFRVLRAELVLCERCTNQSTNFFGKVKLSPEDYSLHPWARRAAELGYTTFLSADELLRLRPTP
jgi:ribosomal protein L34E